MIAALVTTAFLFQLEVALRSLQVVRFICGKGRWRGTTRELRRCNGYRAQKYVGVSRIACSTNDHEHRTMDVRMNAIQKKPMTSDVTSNSKNEEGTIDSASPRHGARSLIDTLRRHGTVV